MPEEPTIPPVIARFIKTLIVASKAVALYPPASSIPRDTAEQALKALRDCLQESSELRLIVNKDGLFYEGVSLSSTNKGYAAFASELYMRHLADVRFHAGTTARDIIAFLHVLKYTPEEVAGAGGYERMLWDLNVTAVTVTETQVTIVGADQIVATDDEAYSLSPEDIEEMLADYASGRPRDRLVMARFLGDAGAVSRYLHHVMTDQGDQFGLACAFDRFAEFAQIVRDSMGGEAQDALVRSLGEVLKELEPEIRTPMLADHVLPQARTNESLADIVRSLDLAELCRVLVEHMNGDDPGKEGLGRALRNIAVIMGADKKTFSEVAAGTMKAAGFSESAIAHVLETAQPSKLEVPAAGAGQAASRRPLDAILHMLDAATVDEAEAAEDEDLTAIREEAMSGITDGDVLMAYVQLLYLDSRESQFASTMALLEDALDVLVDRGDLELAADAADALRKTADSPDLGPEQQRRVVRAMGRLTKPEDIRTVAHALRLYKPDSPENKAARRLLTALGPAAIDPLLEQLAEEPDMAVRKSLVDLLSEMAPVYLAEVGAHVSDHRWYVVRNVVGILGSSRTSAMLPYLERTLRHNDVRVRRETIRALSGVSDRVAHEMLVYALNDDDAQNVQLAARCLGTAHVDRAIPVLEQVARGEGRGNRDTGPRVEAIETLGRLRATQSLPTLEALAGRRAIIGAAKARELKTAAETAIARIRADEGGA